MLTVAAKDFGPIIEGTVELRPLTVFVGPSNTGKSYLATLVYALMEATTGGIMLMPGSDSRDSGFPRQMLPLQVVNMELDEDVKGAILLWVQDAEINDSISLSFRFGDLPSPVQELVNAAMSSSFQSCAKPFNKELRMYHGEVPDLIRRYPREAKLQVCLKQDQPTINLSFEQVGHSVPVALAQEYFEIPVDTGIQFDTSLLRQIQAQNTKSGPTRRALESYCYRLLFDMLNAIAFSMFEKFPRNSYYLPAARSGITQGRREIASALVRQSDASNLPGIITDFISTMLLVRKRGLEEIDPELQEATDFLEQQVIRGKVNLEESELPYPEIYYETDAGKFLLRQTSSMVSELAPLILFLKYLVRPGDLLILEEPESHLHPASQRRMAQGIVRLVNAGVRMLVTTHSDYFLNQLNNLMIISDADAEWREQKGFEQADCLNPAAVSAYAFHWDTAEGGSRVEQLTIRPDLGIDDTEFGEVVNEQYEETILVQGIPLK